MKNWKGLWVNFMQRMIFKKSLRYPGKESARREGEIESRVKYMIISEKSDCISVNRAAECLMPADWILQMAGQIT